MQWRALVVLGGGAAALQGGLAGIDPGAVRERAWPLDQVLGSVVHASATLAGPGRRIHVMGNGLLLGPVVDAGAPRLAPVLEVFEAAGFKWGRKRGRPAPGSLVQTVEI